MIIDNQNKVDIFTKTCSLYKSIVWWQMVCFSDCYNDSVCMLMVYSENVTCCEVIYIKP